MTAPTDDVSTWDLVFATRATQLNLIIASSALFPRTIDWPPSATNPRWVKGTIGSWAVVPGGDSRHVLLQATVNGVTFGGPGIPPGASLATLTMNAVFSLRFISADGVTQHLKVAPPAPPAGASLPADIELRVTFLEQEVISWGMPLPERSALQHALNDWLQSSEGQIEHVFAQIDVLDAAATGDFSWLKSTTVDYAYSPNAEGDTNLDNAVLGVLAMTSGRSPGPLTPIQVSPQVIPHGVETGALISSDLYLQSALLPKAAVLVSGTTAADFQYDPHTATISLINPAAMADVPSSDGTPCPCSLTQLDLTLVGSEIRVTYTTRVLVKETKTVVVSLGGGGQPGKTEQVQDNVCYSCASGAHFFTLVAGPYDASTRTQPVTFSQSRSDAPRSWVEPPPDDPDKDIKQVLNYLTLAVVIAATFVEPALGLAYTLGCVGASLASDIENDQARLQNFSTAPYIQSGAMAEAMALTWGGAGELQLSSVALNDGLQFGGQLVRLGGS